MLKALMSCLGSVNINSIPVLCQENLQLLLPPVQMLDMKEKTYLTHFNSKGYVLFATDSTLTRF